MKKSTNTAVFNTQHQATTKVLQQELIALFIFKSDVEDENSKNITIETRLTCSLQSTRATVQLTVQDNSLTHNSCSI